MPRTILHVDMDAFFAAVEQRDDPALRGKPVLVGGSSRRGVVTAASYEARVFGCRSAMPTGQALRLCPHAIVVKGRFDAYRQVSRQVFDILAHYTPLVQPLSIDEAYLDVTGSLRLFGDGPAIARDIRRRVWETVELTCSVGVASNKFLAKLASDLNKPNGLTIIAADDIDKVLCPLPVSVIWGIGPQTVRRLERFGIRTVADLRKMPPAFFENKAAGVGNGIRGLIFGRDDRPVTPDRDAKSIGHEHTFGDDLDDPDQMRAVLMSQVEHVAARLRKADGLARNVSLKLRHGGTYREFVTLTRAATLPQPTDQTRLIWESARTLFDAWAAHNLQPLRLLGVSVSDLSRAAQDQPGLFPDPQAARARRLDQTLDLITTKLGRNSLRRGLSAPPR